MAGIVRLRRKGEVSDLVKQGTGEDKGITGRKLKVASESKHEGM